MVNNLTLLIGIPILIGIINIILPSMLKKILNMVLVLYLLFVTSQIYINLSGDIVPNVMLFDTLILSIDKLSFLMIAFIQLLSLIIFVFAYSGVNEKIMSKFMILYPLTIGFSNGAILSVNSWSLLIFWGLSGIMLYLFGLLGNTKDTSATAKKTFIIVGGSDVLLILGLVFLRFLEYSNGWQLWDIKVNLEGEIAYIAFISLLIASFAKAGVFPFHTWLPDYSKDTPVESVAFLPASIDKLLGIYLLARLVLSVFVINITVHLVLMSIGAFTIIIAVMMALIQHNGRRLLGYHAVSQVGYMVLGIGTASVLAFAGGLFHLINNTLYKTGLFLSLGSVEKQTGTNDLDELGGLGNKMFLTFLPALIAALSISGIPPFNGFFSKWMIYQGVLDFAKDLTPGYQIWALVCLILAIFGSALTLASFLKFLHTIFLGRTLKKFEKIQESPVMQWVATSVLALLCVIFGIFAVKIPLEKLIYPVLIENGMSLPIWIGTYSPIMMISLFGLIFILGYAIYIMTKSIRYDDIYLGGMDALEKYRITGTGWYNEIKNMSPLKGFYSAAEIKLFDIYSWLKGISVVFAKILSLLHLGQLQFYSLWIVVGTLILLWVIK